jgi:hypothetical protein
LYPPILFVLNVKVFSPKVNMPKREAEQSLPSQAEVKNVWSFSSMFLILLEENGAYKNSDSATNVCNRDADHMNY